MLLFENKNRCETCNTCRTENIKLTESQNQMKHELILMNA